MISKEVSTLPIICELYAVKTLVCMERRYFLEVVNLFLPAVQISIVDAFQMHKPIEYLSTALSLDH